MNVGGLTEVLGEAHHSLPVLIPSFDHRYRKGHAKLRTVIYCRRTCSYSEDHGGPLEPWEEREEAVVVS